jgi:branched-chain amino acid transport system substrate-binding protein
VWSENPWGSGISELARLVYDKDVWAIVGAPDSASAHLVEQLVAKARLTFVNPIATDRTANSANVPWIFSCAPGDHILAPMLAEALVERTGGNEIALVSATDHGSRQFVNALAAALGTRETFPAVRVEFRPRQVDFDAQLSRLRVYPRAAVAVVAGPSDSARLVGAMRENGLRQPLFGGPAMGHDLFVRSAGAAAEGVVFPLLWHSAMAGARSTEFSEHFVERCGTAPDYTAAYTHDALSMLIAAIDRSGLDRAQIRDALAGLSPWPGVTGTITWDDEGQNRNGCCLGTIRNGRRVLLSPTATYKPTEANDTSRSELGSQMRRSVISTSAR